MCNAPDKQAPKLEPILVKNPLSNRYVNVAPMFQIMNDMFDDHFSDLSQQLTKAIEMAAVYTDKDFRNRDDYSWNMFIFFQIRDMFNNMEEFSGEKR